MRLGSLILLVGIILAACGEAVPPQRSTRIDSGDGGDGDGDGDTGDGDGDGDGDTGDGDGDGDTGDGDGDGDEIGGTLIPIDREFVPQPQDLRQFNSVAGKSVIDLSDDGHVLFRDYESAAVAGERAFVWRGSGEPELVPFPAGVERMRIVCLLSDDRFVLGLPFVNPVTGAYSYGSLLPMLVEGGVAEKLVNPNDDYFEVVRCNDAGQALVRRWQVLGSGPILQVPSTGVSNLGFNNAGMGLFDDGYWDGTEMHALPENFKPYSGPTEDAKMLGSIDELLSSETQAVVWDPAADDKITLIPRIPGLQEVPEPIMIGPEGDIVIGTGIFDEEANVVYLYRKGKFAMLGTEGVDIGEVLDVNAKGQVLVEVVSDDADKGHAAILFSPRN